MTLRFFWPLALLLAGCAALTTTTENLSIGRGKLTLRLDKEVDRLELFHEDHGLLLLEGELLMEGRSWEEVLAGKGSSRLVLLYGGGRTMTLRLEADCLTVTTPANVKLRFETNRDLAFIPAFLQDQKEEDHKVLITTLGPAEVPGARSLFDPQLDLALTLEAEKGMNRPLEDAWRIEAEAPAGEGTIRLLVLEDYYKKKLGVDFYKPMEKRSFWKTAPVVAMTWYGICGVKRPQDLDLLKPEIDWVAEHLLPYAGNLVFQLDDNYDYKSDEKMRALSDYIRGRGLIPGIWFTPYSVAPEEVFKEHPGWFLIDEEGKGISSFGGLNWRWDRPGQEAGVLNMESVGAVENWFNLYWRKVSERWNFDFFKIDGQPRVAAAYRRAANAKGLDSYRKGLSKAREIVGKDKFINGCWGMPIEGAGIMNGSRTGGDTGYWGHAVGVIIGLNYLNNIVWWCDPDAAAVQYDKPVEVVRLNSQARALTGQQFLTDDFWSQVPPENRRVWQHSFPMLDVKPANLYPIGEERTGYDTFDLRIAKSWGTYDVVGLFNFDDHSEGKVLDLGRLPLEAEEVHVFEYWSSEYLGRFDAKGAIPFVFKSLEGKLFSVVPVKEDHPLLLSTSRHVSQGGLDVDFLKWERRGDGWVVEGRSSHLVQDDPYELVFVSGRYRIVESKADGGAIQGERESCLSRVKILPEAGGSLTWRIRFEPITGPVIGAFPGMCEVTPKSFATVTIASLGDEGTKWNTAPSDPRIRLSASEGLLGSWPDATRIQVTVDADGLEPGATWEGYVDIGNADRIHLRIHVPPPENLALQAEASASSKWDETDAHHAGRINDGKRETRWNSAKGDESGCWVQLDWADPVTFNRIVINECTDYGLRIQAWRLLAGPDASEVIARGETLGDHHVVTLSKPLTTGRLKLIVDKASVTPTIRELEVYLWKSANDKK